MPRPDMGDRPPRLSIVLAAFNVEKEIRVLLDSLGACAEPGWEVCVCDDGSTDGTREVIESYRERFNLRLTVNERNRGVTFARNRALALATGELLLFLDSDIRLHADTIARLMDSMNRTRADAVVAIYSPVSLNGGLVSSYYAALVHHSFLIADHPVPYNVFNGWCSLCRREVMEAVSGYNIVAKGVEIENEALGRKIVSRGFRIFLDPSIAVDHRWGGLQKIFFIFTRRVYWWVKIFFATGRRFESCLTTASYGFATPAFPAACAALAGSLLWPRAAALALVLGAAFLAAYAPFYLFAFRRNGLFFAAACVALSLGFSFVITASAGYSALEELLTLAMTGQPTLEPGLFQA